MASHVAEFDTPAPPTAAPQTAHVQQPLHQNYPPHPMHMMQTHPHYANYAAHMTANAASTQSGTQQQQPTVKAEPVDTRYMLNYTLPPLPGPNVAAARPATTSALPPHPGGQTGVISFAKTPQTQTSTSSSASSSAPGRSGYTSTPQQSGGRIPQVDGPSESSDDDDSPPPSFAPRTMHPSLPQPANTPRQEPAADAEAINSDLDDSDTENEEEADEGGAGESDIVFCTYDKVGVFFEGVLEKVNSGWFIGGTGQE